MWTLFTFAVMLAAVGAQENAQTSVSQSLQVCYQNRSILERDNRLPMTMSTLIDLIRKVEEADGLNMDIKDLTVSLLHRFKQDGIEYQKGTHPSSLVLPFGSSGYQFQKHKILLTRLIPGDARRFPNETLTTQEQCALHFMVSNSIDLHVRGDEAQRCSSLAQYRTNRIPRGADVETFKHPKNTKSSGRLQADIDENYDEDEEQKDSMAPRAYDFGVDTDTNMVSQCPVENGVIRTPWGTISAGTLLAGIAAGLVQQNVRVSDVLLGRTKEGLRARQLSGQVVDNRWAATLSGDLAEVALRQGPKNSIQVGAKGAWNSTAEPKWHFLSQRDHHEMTDAEIRGGIDGLIIAKNIETWKNNFNGLKLSQVLSMYYSMRGVFNGNEKACKRRELFATVAPGDEMRAQTSAFTTVLDKELTYVTVSDVAMARFSDSASEALLNYVPNSLNDLPCEVTRQGPLNNSTSTTITDIFIFVEGSWAFEEIRPIVFDILERPELNVRREGSQYTIFNAMDTQIIVNRTNDLTNLTQEWTYETHLRREFVIDAPERGTAPNFDAN